MSDEFAARIKKCMMEVLSVEESQLQADAKIGDDLDADDLDLVELVMAIEEEFDIEITEEEIEYMDLANTRPADEEPPRIPLSSRYMQFDLPQRYLSLNATVGEFIDIIGRIRDQSP